MVPQQYVQHDNDTLTQKAQGLVEFALVLPILLLLLLGLIEFGRLVFIYGASLASSQEAARYGAAAGFADIGKPYYADCAGIRSAAKRIGTWAGIQDGDIAIEYDDGATVIASSCEDLVDHSTVGKSDRILVIVTAHYQPLVPSVPVPKFPITAETARTIVKDVQIRGAPAPRPTSTPTPTPSS